jgi:hypothetical protein
MIYNSRRNFLSEIGMAITPAFLTDLKAAEGSPEKYLVGWGDLPVADL